MSHNPFARWASPLFAAAVRRPRSADPEDSRRRNDDGEDERDKGPTSEPNDDDNPEDDEDDESMSLAEQIIRADEKRRGAHADPSPMGPLAKAIVAADRKRRGEL